jgi:hypothetical protein
VTTFVAIYRGSTVAEARLVAVSADPALVADVSGRLLQRPLDETADPVIGSLERGRRAALRMIKREAGHEPVS